MAKSLRSHSKLAARNRKRYTEGSDYAVTAAARLQQVSDRLKQRVHTPKVSEMENDAGMDEEAQDEPTDAMHTDDKPSKPAKPYVYDASKKRMRRKMHKKKRGGAW